MIMRVMRAVGLLAVVLIAAVSALLLANGAPRPRATLAGDGMAKSALTKSAPYVVKLHARWCPVCMVTRSMWSEIERTYAGRVHLVVFDFTTEASTAASRVEAARLGLEPFFDDYAGVTGSVVVLDGRTKAVASEIDGSRDFTEYRAAIDASLSGALTSADGRPPLLQKFLRPTLPQ